VGLELGLPDEKEREEIFDQLRAYCKQDTWAMVELRRALGEKVE
jgi:hypothetical protein